MSALSLFSTRVRAVVAGVLLLSLFGAGCTKIQDPETTALSAPVTLNVWGVIDDQNAYAAAIKAYSSLYPNVTINYRRIDPQDYESEIINGLAEDRGPDIFLLHNDWTSKYLSKLSYMPASARVAQQSLQGTIQKQAVWNSVTVPLMTNQEYADQFVDTVLRDTVRNVTVTSADGATGVQTHIVGIPTFIDTMALYYNRSLLNVAGIPLPPENWQDFQADVRKLTKRDIHDPTKILQSGAAIGMGSNVERSTDILVALMMQNGAQMTTPDGQLDFQNIPQELQGSMTEAPAVGALRFYTEFADPTKDTYTWNADQQNSLTAFTQGKTAFFFGYDYQQDVIKSLAPQINLGITKLPQIGGRDTKNVANYWYWGVSKKSKNQAQAWNFLTFLSQHDQEKSVSDVIKRPSPRRDVLVDQIRDEKMGVFASQVLTAQTWYEGRDPVAMEQAFMTLMDKVALKQTNMSDAMQFILDQVQQTY